MEFLHEPIFVEESFSLLDIHAKDVIFDLTVGLGGHAHAFLSRCPDVKYIGIDRDAEALQKAAKRLSDFPQCTLVHRNYSEIEKVASEYSVFPTVIFADLGVSSYQLDSHERGFSWKKHGPLDMRMDRSEPTTAADMMQKLSIREIEKILREYGDISRNISTTLAQVIYSVAKERSLSSNQLVAKIKQTQPKIDNKIMTQIFQAIRIKTNQETKHVERMLGSSFNILSSQCRMGIISFHSGEDALVKNFYNTHKNKNNEKYLKAKKPYPVKPSSQEVFRNPRARSAKMRVFEVYE